GSGSGSGSAAATPPVAAAKAPTPAAADGGDDPAIAAGKRVAKALEPCNLRRRAGPELRIAVYVNAKRSNAIRGFVSRQPWMTATHTRCVKRALVGLELGITLRAAGFIEWGLRLRPDQTIVRLRRPKRLPLLR
ncbi:MAG: hypothetical protein KC503_00400, partial [Myxococcales bacterium]|nr:hypothetical protein [Myxococcales bacterium]